MLFGMVDWLEKIKETGGKRERIGSIEILRW
jgi:hypothetical protein